MPGSKAPAQNAKIEVDALISDERWQSSLSPVTIAETAISHAAEFLKIEGKRDREVSVLFCSDAEIRQLNAQWRGIDKPTNVLAFPAATAHGQQVPQQLGDIAAAFETCVREAEEQSISVADHLTHLMVHGFLHLMGFDHENDEDAETMEQAEIDILAGLGVENPYK